MARYKKATVTEDLTAGTLTWTFANGKERVLNVDALPDNMKRRGMFHGFTQKGSDCYAGVETVDGAYEECDDTLSHIEAGEWSAKREKGEPTLSLFAEALERWLVAEVETSKADVIRDRVRNGGPNAKGQTWSAEEWRKNLRETAQIKKYIAVIQQERAEKAAALATADAGALV